MKRPFFVSAVVLATGLAAACDGPPGPDAERPAEGRFETRLGRGDERRCGGFGQVGGACLQLRTPRE